MVFVQTVEPDARLSVEPAGIVPILAAEPELFRVTVFPLEVTEVVGVFLVVVGVLVVVVVVFVVVVVPGAGLAAVPAGTSVSAGCALTHCDRFPELRYGCWAPVALPLLVAPVPVDVALPVPPTADGACTL